MVLLAVKVCSINMMVYYWLIVIEYLINVTVSLAVGFDSINVTLLLTVGFDSILAVLLAVKFYSINTVVLLAISFENIYVKA